MTTYNFTLLFTGPDALSPENFEALVAAGCDDASFGETDGRQLADFDRESNSYASAVISAIREMERAVPGIQVSEVESDTLVGISDIAERAGLSREYVRLLAEGKRGPGTFPRPIASLGINRAVWDWPVVAKWLREAFNKPVPVSPHAETVAAINAALDVRTRVRCLPPPERSLLGAWVAGEVLFGPRSVSRPYPAIPDPTLLGHTSTQLITLAQLAADETLPGTRKIASYWAQDLSLARDADQPRNSPSMVAPAFASFFESMVRPQPPQRKQSSSVAEQEIPLHLLAQPA